MSCFCQYRKALARLFFSVLKLRSLKQPPNKQLVCSFWYLNNWIRSMVQFSPLFTAQPFNQLNKEVCASHFSFASGLFGFCFLSRATLVSLCGFVPVYFSHLPLTLSVSLSVSQSLSLSLSSLLPFVHLHLFRGLCLVLGLWLALTLWASSKFRDIFRVPALACLT